MYNKNRILIVDDQKTIRETLKQLLNTEDYQLDFACCGEEALTQAEKLYPDLILLDVVMPGEMDGFAACAKLRAHPKLAEVPIIMITSCNDRQARLHGIEVGADDFITKPFDPDELCARIRAITRLNRYRHLLLERSRFEWAVEQSNDGYVLLNNGDIISYANSSARFYLGILKESDLPASFLKLLQAQHYRREPDHAWDSWPEPLVGSLSRYLMRAETPHSQSVWLQIDIFDLPSDNIRNQLVHLRDVSEHLNLQQQMWTFQTLVSHKLRGPLNGLVGLQMLDERIMDLSSSRAQTLLKIARDSAKRLQDQILDILRYIDSSQFHHLNNSFNLSELPELLEKIRKDLDLEILPVSMDMTLTNQSINISSSNLELILRELSTNAKKFHPRQFPTIQVSVTSQEANNVILSFSDNGQSMSNQELNRVWTPYYQSEKYFTGEVKGMGLGLPMIARLLRNRGGHCRLLNREDQPGIVAELTLLLSTPNKNQTVFGV